MTAVDGNSATLPACSNTRSRPEGQSNVPSAQTHDSQGKRHISTRSSVNYQRSTRRPAASFDGGRPKSSVSHHFRILREPGLVRTRVAGTVHQDSLRRAELDARFPGLMEAVIKQIINNPALSESA
ncbi:ArsR/SmtB family transcription factor [Caballeronia grimmiae]|uniref:ArsR/SmtB family transcription factor n=1 Tax=Caballeronia grimmiae TaxID=1071679 RepID=UPI0038B7214D